MTTVLAGARVVTPTAVLDPGIVMIEGDRIVDVQPGGDAGLLASHLVVPGFVDVHVHGVEGIDSLIGLDAVERMAAVLPRYGITAFCPTSIACSPSDLRRFLDAVAHAREHRVHNAARVLSAHLESNFINPAYCGAQPLSCLRVPQDGHVDHEHRNEFTAQDIWDEIVRAGSAIGIVTLAPELPGVLEMIQRLSAAGCHVSLGHSAATYDEGLAGIDAGARHATHLFNRMPPFSHRDPGLVGAILDRPEVMAELIVDGHHVHPAVGRVAQRALGPDRVMAITDGTAVSGLPPGTVAHLGSSRIVAGADVARLEDGTWAGSRLTMDGAFRNLVRLFGSSILESAKACSTNPARALSAPNGDGIVPGGLADLVILGPDLQVVQTYIAGQPVLGG